MKTFTIDQIKRFVKSQDSFGDIHHNLSEANIEKANKTISFTLEDILENGNNWEDFCQEYGISEYAVNEGGGHIPCDIFLNDAKKYNLI